jgi:hypothetical protein
MPLWGFKRSKNESAAGDLNSAASYKKGQQPDAGGQAINKAGKRNVIATSAGWVRRTVGTGARSGRTHDEILVSANPGIALDGYANSAHLGFPDCTTLYLTDGQSSNTEYTAKLSNGNISITGGSQVATVHLVFNEPVSFFAPTGGLANLMITATLTANTTDAAGAEGDVLFQSNITSGAIHTANNVVPFTSNATLLVGATYKFEAQSLVQHSANATVGLRALNDPDRLETANVVFTGAASNTLPAFTVST